MTVKEMQFRIRIFITKDIHLTTNVCELMDKLYVKEEISA